MPEIQDVITDLEIRMDAAHQGADLATMERLAATIVQKAPSHIKACQCLGEMALKRFEVDEALHWLTRAYEVSTDENPTDNIRILRNLARAYFLQDNFDRCIALMGPTMEEHPLPTYRDQMVFGEALFLKGQYHEALPVIREACVACPEEIDWHVLLADCCIKLDNFDIGIKLLEQALQQRPNDIKILDKYAYACQCEYRYSDCISAYRKLLDLEPGRSSAYCNLGLTLQELGQLALADDMYQRSLACDQEDNPALNNRAYLASYRPDLGAEEVLKLQKIVANEIIKHTDPPFISYDNNRDPDRPLRIGYMSPDFRRHACNFFIMPLFEKRDRRQFELYAYAEEQRVNAITDHFRSLSDHWYNTKDVETNRVCEQIRADKIDILIDLAGHCASNRLDVMARRPAPVSMTWLGYGNTTGMDRIDYFLADDRFTPKGSEAAFAEKLWRLPTSFMCYRPDQAAPDIKPLPARENGYVTFGSLSRGVRFNPEVIKTWAEILSQVPKSRLLIHTFMFNDPKNVDEFKFQFKDLGISADRLSFFYHPDYWDSYAALDIALDPFPHNCGTTSFETLWSGVPIINLKHRPPVGCFGNALLPHVGLSDLVTDNCKNYVAKAVELANDLDRLEGIRRRLREDMKASALCDEEGFISSLEAAYREMWKSWVRNTGTAKT